jgi:hypothetical protein
MSLDNHHSPIQSASAQAGQLARMQSQGKSLPFKSRNKGYSADADRQSSWARTQSRRGFVNPFSGDFAHAITRGVRKHFLKPMLSAELLSLLSDLMNNSSFIRHINLGSQTPSGSPVLEIELACIDGPDHEKTSTLIEQAIKDGFEVRFLPNASGLTQ